MLQQTVQADEARQASDNLHSFDKNSIALMNEQIQSVLARLGGKSESQEPFNDDNRLQKQASAEASRQTAGDVVSNEVSLTGRIEDTLGRLKNHASSAPEETHHLQDHPYATAVDSAETAGDSGLVLSAHVGSTSRFVANETALARHIEEALGRLKNQTSKSVEETYGLKDNTLSLPGDTAKTGSYLNAASDLSVTRPAHFETKAEQSADSLNTSIHHQKQIINTPINNSDGFSANSRLVKGHANGSQ